MHRFSALTLLIFSLSYNISFTIAITGYTISPTHPIRDGEFVVSNNGAFKLGFFSLLNNTNRYVGIWYAKISVRTYVWIANRDDPIKDSSGVLKIGSYGNLTLFDGDGKIVWLVGQSSTNSTAVLHDSGNLILKEANTGDEVPPLWQSYDDPTDTLLPNMRLSVNLTTHVEKVLRSWRSENDPGSGEYTSSVDSTGARQLFICHNGVPYFRSGEYQKRTELKCKDDDEFLLVQNMKLPDRYNVLANSSLEINDCKSICQGNCSCTAYASAYMNRTGCFFWGGELIDLGEDLPLFSFSTVVSATCNFSNENKLGEGGFGPVYKGKLSDGREVAVKRLSRSSGQGLEEFKNEATLIARLQHTNLVKLIGCCIEGEEKMLIYEYMPNRSLDSILFNQKRKASLNWEVRLRIIEGVAQGLLYLHKYSRLRIIHRDLKASNILLDNEMNPKISDFGTARIFKANQNQANTIRVVGTYGYMPPEYVFRGFFSEKSDVFSYGVLLLEIVSGRKSASFYQSNDSWNLLQYAWELWEEDKALELMDPLFGDASCPSNEVLKCIQIGLLCVQERAIDRPTMSDVVALLGTDITSLPVPNQAAFSTGTGLVSLGIHLSSAEDSNSNEVTITTLEGR
ncbi:G-type lectin S-receptor-like serine/threonine-protein kinase [Acorus gramineus]|uniref:G-type lectin S-receptor-like serine/threonine-protein kinase n=1 Tax=Acorus gramineus TaxID=55184 RepID=A0AAV9BVV8_ACOGR|nr:G-type lectin S-receptor-like serine/threonine-protein kinase [Acorus gramineus]